MIFSQFLTFRHGGLQWRGIIVARSAMGLLERRLFFLTTRSYALTGVPDVTALWRPSAWHVEAGTSQYWQAQRLPCATGATWSGSPSINVRRLPSLVPRLYSIPRHDSPEHMGMQLVQHADFPGQNSCISVHQLRPAPQRAMTHP